MTADGLDLTHFLAVLIGMTVVAIVTFHMALGRRLGRRYMESWGDRPPQPSIGWPLYGLAIVSMGLGILLLLTARPSPVSIKFLIAQILVNVPAAGYGWMLYRAHRR